MINIDKYKVYNVDNYYFKNFVTLSIEEKNMILSWRNDKRISKWMCNREPLSLENHINFIEGLKHRTDVYYWLVVKDEIPLGVFDIIDVDTDKNDCEPGYYLNPEFLDSGIGLQFNYYCRSFVYNILDIPSVKGHILVGNTSAYTMSRFFGVKEVSKVVREGYEYLGMKGNKKDFFKNSPKLLSKEFVRFVKANPVDWVSIVKNISNE